MEREISLFEKACKAFKRFPKIPISSQLREKYEEEILFCDLDVEPQDIVKVSVYLPLFVFLLLSGLLFVTHISDVILLLFTAITSVLISYFLFNYTHFLSIKIRTKASAEMSAAIIYMALSLRMSPNIERAVAFASENLSGPLGRDFKKIIWKLKTGEILTIDEGIEWLCKKWKKESEEFEDALSLLVESVSEPREIAERTLEKAVSIMLKGDQERMKKYSLRMKTPLKVITMFGVVFPTLLMAFLPSVSFFIPEIIKPAYFAFAYLFFIPFSLFVFLSEYRMAKPSLYHQTEIFKTEEFKKKERTVFIISLLSFLVLFPPFFYKLITLPESFTYEGFFYALGLVLSIGIPFLIYSFSIKTLFEKKNKKLCVIENELPIVVSNLALISSRGKPLEKCLEDLKNKLPNNMESREMISKIVHKLKETNYPLEEILFSKEGVLSSYPSKLVKVVFGVIVTISRKGSIFLSNILNHLSAFLRQVKEVSFFLEETLSEVISEAEITSKVMLPVSAGAIVGLIAVVYYVLFKLSKLIGSSSLGPVLSETNKVGLPLWFSSLSVYIPFHWLEVIIGVYMIELVLLLSSFFGEINFGEDKIKTLGNMGKSLLIDLAIYSLLSVAIYVFMFSTVSNIV